MAQRAVSGNRRLPREPARNAGARLSQYARIRLLAGTVVVSALTAVASPVAAFDPEQTFTSGAFALSLCGGGGEQASFSACHRERLDFWWVDGRVSWVPFGTVGKDGPFDGALEAGATGAPRSQG